MTFCYETIYILLPDLDDEAVEAAKGRVIEIVTATGGRVFRRESWGRKRLAYTVAKQQRGNYQLIQYVGDGKTVADLERLFRLDDAFIKFLTIKLRRDPATVTDESAEEVTRETEPAPDRDRGDRDRDRDRGDRDRDRDRGPRGRGRDGGGGGGRREPEEAGSGARTEATAPAGSDATPAPAAPAAAE